MAKLSTLFDYQKIAKSNRLQSIIDDVDSKYLLNNELDDDELGFVNAGLANAELQNKLSKEDNGFRRF